jgi:hypothetical protein
MESENVKTGNMVQVWILNRNESPVESVKSGNDANVCFDCVHRGTDGFKDRSCYVNVAQGPSAVWRAYQKGKYRLLERAEYARVFGARAVRFGAYGEPVLIPVDILRAIAEVATGHTGYTHQWRRAEFQAYRALVMASCDTAADYTAAKQLGWRTFRVRTSADAPLLAREISCPASDEMDKRTQCVRCRLCNGAQPGDLRKDIVIIAHGIGARNFIKLEAIAAA